MGPGRKDCSRLITYREEKKETEITVQTKPSGESRGVEGEETLQLMKVPDKIPITFGNLLKAASSP